MVNRSLWAVWVVIAAALAPVALSSILITIKTELDADFLHFRFQSPRSYVMKAQYADKNWGAQFKSKDIVRDFINIHGEKACNSFSKQRQAQVKGRVMLIERGNCTFITKGHHCANAGAYACLIYDPELNEQTQNVEHFISMPADDDDVAKMGRVNVPVAYVRREDAFYIRDIISKDAVAVISLNLNFSTFILQEQSPWNLW